MDVDGSSRSEHRLPHVTKKGHEEEQIYAVLVLDVTKLFDKMWPQRLL